MENPIPEPDRDPSASALREAEPEFEPRWQEEVQAAEAEAKRAGPTKWLRWVFVLVLLGLAVYLIIPQLGDVRESAKVLRTMRPWAVGLAILSEILSYVALGYMMKRIVGLTGQVLTLHRAFGVTLASGAVGLVAGGLVGIGGSSFRWLRDAGIRPEGALLAGWLPTLLNASTIAVFALLGMVQLVLVQDLRRRCGSRSACRWRCWWWWPARSSGRPGTATRPRRSSAAGKRSGRGCGRRRRTPSP